jgi:hypothetical protein
LIDKFDGRENEKYLDPTDSSTLTRVTVRAAANAGYGQAPTRLVKVTNINTINKVADPLSGRYRVASNSAVGQLLITPGFSASPIPDRQDR